MKNLPVLIVLLAGQNALAVSDDEIIRQMASSSSLSEEVIRAHYKTGCSSGEYVPMLTCVRFSYLYADAELNEAYQSLRKQLTTKTAKAALANAERAWVAYRDATCEYEAEGAGGRFWSVHHFGCLTTVTNQRVSKLKEYLECKLPGCPGEW